MPSAAGGCDGDLEAACTTLVDVLMDFCQRLGTLVPRGTCVLILVVLRMFFFFFLRMFFISLGPHIWTYLIASLNLRNEGKLLVSSFSLSHLVSKREEKKGLVGGGLQCRHPSCRRYWCGLAATRGRPSQSHLGHAGCGRLTWPVQSDRPPS